MASHKSSRPTKSQVRKALRQLDKIRAEMSRSGLDSWSDEDQQLYDWADARYGQKR